MLRALSCVLILLLVSACAGNQESTDLPEADSLSTVTGRPSTQAEGASPDVDARASVYGITPSSPAQDTLLTGTEGLPWWNSTVFYEVFVRSFQDSDGDGVGDLAGLIERLDYLNDGDPSTTDDLGISGIWLMPITESPSYHGYDVVDYFQVDQEYGTNQLFLQLVDESHARGIRVIVDLVLNHTSRSHPWFQESLDRNSDKREWYIWSDVAPGYQGPTGQRVWHPVGGDYYYAIFGDGMPDLNYENPAVTAAMQEVTRFWLEAMKVDGFRLDAIKHLIEEGRALENTPSTHTWLTAYHDFYKGINATSLVVGEAWTSTQQVLKYTGDEADIAFAFDLALDILNSSGVGIGSMVAESQLELVENFPPGQYAVFITNHDQNRVMSQLNGDEGAAKIAASILLTSPGVPFIYYGEEIGLMGRKPDENIRLPMQWTGHAPGAGFTEGTPWRSPGPAPGGGNVAQQAEDPGSLLSHYRNLIHMRNKHEALRIGDWKPVSAQPGRILAFLRQSDEETLLVLINPSRRVVEEFTLTLENGFAADGEVGAELLFGEGDVRPPTLNESGGFDEYEPLEVLSPQSTYIIQITSDH